MAKGNRAAFISFLSELVIVTISIYLPYRAFQLGADAVLIGLVGASGSAVYMFAPFLMGRLTDRVGPTKLVQIGTSVVTALCFVYAFIPSPLLFLPLRLVEGFGWAMVWPPLEVLSSLGGNDIKKSIRTFNMAWGSGAIVAPLVGGLIVDIVAASGTLLVSGLVMFLGLIVSLGLGGRPAGHGPPPGPPKARLSLGALAPLLSFSFVYGLTMTTISTFFPRYAAGLELDAALWGTVLSSLMAGRLVAFIVSGRVLASLGPRRSQLSFLLVATAFPALSVAGGAGATSLILSSFITGGSLGIVYAATLNAMLSGPAETRGRAAGLFESVLGFGSFIGPALAGGLASSGLWLTMAFPLVPLGGVFAFGLLSRPAKRPSRDRSD
jgi:MFS family permease